VAVLGVALAQHLGGQDRQLRRPELGVDPPCDLIVRNPANPGHEVLRIPCGSADEGPVEAVRTVLDLLESLTTTRGASAVVRVGNAGAVVALHDDLGHYNGSMQRTVAPVVESCRRRP
jgi:hypothetical protein